MKAPTEYELEQLMHGVYDPVKARAYYLRTRKLKGRKKGSSNNQDPRLRSRAQKKKDARVKQRKQLADAIQNLERNLRKLEAKIQKMERAEKSENRKGKAKKERAAKEKDKPKSAAEKAQAARENEKYRKKNQGVLKTKAKKTNAKKSGGGSSKGKTNASKKRSVSELKSLATRVRGQIAIAKTKLAAL